MRSYPVQVAFIRVQHIRQRLQVPDDLARLLRHPSLGRMRRKADQMNPACPDLDKKEDTESLEANRFNREEIAREQSILVVVEVGSPCSCRLLLGNGRYAVAAQDLMDGFMADPITELLQFSGDAVVTPTILTDELEHQLDNLRFDGWSPDTLRLMFEGPLTFDQLAVLPE